MIRKASLALVALAACTQEADVSVTRGEALYLENCVACHGVDGRGTGEMADQLIREPSDLTQLTRDNGGVFPRDHVMSMIDGYRRGERFSAAMPEFGDGDLGHPVIVDDGTPNGTPIPADLLSLAIYLESLQR